VTASKELPVGFNGSAGSQMGGQWHRTSRECTLFNGKGNEIHELGTGTYVSKRIISAVMRVESVSDRMSYIILRGRWSHIIVLNFHGPAKDKIDDITKRV
jgi:hypothetical protein